MTRFLLIRHASHDLLGRVLAGRAPDVHLSARGKLEAERLAEVLASTPLSAIYTSPMERARETACPLASRHGLTARVNPAFHEIDFGDWTYLSFAELDPRPEWQLWNNSRGRAVPPRGEAMGAAQTRVTRELLDLSRLHIDQTIAVVSHGDLIKSALMYYLEIPLDLHARLEISPASVSELHLSAHHSVVVSVNVTSAL